MDGLQNERELKKFNEWRKEIGKKLPNLAERVFALRRVGYAGCGFHWSLEKGLGYIIHMANDFDRSYREFTARIVAEVNYEHFVKRLERIEKEISDANI